MNKRRIQKNTKIEVREKPQWEKRRAKKTSKKNKRQFFKKKLKKSNLKIDANREK